MATGAQLYLDLLARVVTNQVYRDAPIPAPWDPDPVYDPQLRDQGADWPSVAHTMVGARRLANLRACVESVLADGVPGDIIETGVWRGGACIFARGLLAAHGVTNRTVWVADSFEGIPKTGLDSHPMDQQMQLHRRNNLLSVPIGTVRENFVRYDLLDEQVRFLPGWFKDTLPVAPVERLAVLRLDGDLYESTMVALESLYPKLSVGGYLIVDDYVMPACAKAVTEFRARFDIRDEIHVIDDCGVFWRRSR
jgi:O-methyltransferase/demethyldecarbamoylnovobiocin O-methyltransferase/8-demethyl-8-(2,3-dimethoxy-alpha-L-rhamnosyl)tetracenomycin-C 4'-O-methyltransferase